MKRKTPWLVTFSDLITLLITFFTLIISMSSMDKKVLRQSFTYFSGGPGLTGKGGELFVNLVQIKKKYNLTIADLKSIEDIMKKFNLTPSQSLKLFLLKRYLGKDNIENLNIENYSDVEVKIKSQKLFNPISYELTEYGKIFALGLFKTMKLYTDKLYMEVYTSKFPIETDIVKDNVDLSIKRGAKIIDFLVKKNIDYRRIAIIGWGYNKVSKDIILLKFQNFLKIEGGKNG